MRKKVKLSMVNQILIAVILGVIFGFALPSFSVQLKIIGDIFLKLMQMSIPILVLGQIIQAVGGIKPNELSKLGIKTIVIFAISSLLAAAFGALVGILFKPGIGVHLTKVAEKAIHVKSVSLSETILSFFTSNIFESLSNGTIIQIIIFAIFFGIGLSKFMEKKPKSKLLDLIIDFNDVIIQLVTCVMFFAPIGIFALIASTISNLGIKIILPLIKYLFYYGFATFAYLLIWIVIISLYLKVNPIKLISNMSEMSLMALATTSSAITLPIEMNEAKNKLGLKDRITNLVLPLGMSLNSNGSAMHMAITVITIAQLYNINFTLDKVFYLIVISTFVSLANAVVPGAGLVSLAIIVPQMGLPVESIAIFAGVEWFVGMLRTILNVNSDVYSALMVGKSADAIDYEVFNK